MQLADDIGRGVPAGIGIHHEYQADRERRAGDVGEVDGAWRKRDRLRRAEAKAGDDEYDNEDELQCRPGVMEGAAKPYAAQMHERGKPGDAESERQRRRARQDGFEVDAERHGGERDRRRETDRRRHPAGDKAERRMIDPAQEIVFAARARKHRGEFRIAERSAYRDDAADDPQQQQRKSGGYVIDLKSEAGEDADADHVGDDDRGRRNPRHRGGGRPPEGEVAINELSSPRAPALQCATR